MSPTAPHYLLFTEAKNNSTDKHLGGYWRFVLERIGSTERTQESDEEPGIWGERLQLLAAVRGLESLEHPARITMVTRSKYVGRGIRRQLTQWRQNDWHWERFGQMELIRNHDLWQRIDHAMHIHQINCRVWQFDAPHVSTTSPTLEKSSPFMESRPASDHHSEVSDSGTTIMSDGFRSTSEDPIPTPALMSHANSSISEELQSRVAIKRQRRRRSMDSHEPTHQPIDERLSLSRSSNAIENTIEQVTRVSEMLADKIKPMGMGQAYGYAVN